MCDLNGVSAHARSLGPLNEEVDGEIKSFGNGSFRAIHRTWTFNSDRVERLPNPLLKLFNFERLFQDPVRALCFCLDKWIYFELHPEKPLKSLTRISSLTGVALT